jgi:hypothetical protein
MRTLLKALLFGVVIIVGAAAWDDWEKGKQPRPHNPSPRPSEPPRAQAPQTPSSVDLVIVGVTGTTMQGQRMIQVAVQNIGSSLASGVSGICSYGCVSTGVTVRQEFLPDGYLVPGGVVSGWVPVTPCPDQVIHVRCTVDPVNAIPETNDGNNTFAATISVF